MVGPSPEEWSVIPYGAEHTPDAELDYGERSIHLKVLRACRQLYNEGNQVLWTTNTFSFTNGNSFYYFCDHLKSNQKNLLRSLRLNFGWDDEEDIPPWELPVFSPPSLWNSALRVQILKTLKAVTQLQLVIHMARDADHWQWVKSEFGITDALGASDPETFVRFASLLQRDTRRVAEGAASRTPGESAMKLSILPLAEVSVLMHAEELAIGWSHQQRCRGQPKLWSIEDQQQFAGIIRDRLLAGGGMKAYDDGVKAWRAFQKEYKSKEKERKACKKSQLHAAMLHEARLLSAALHAP
ncbi:MAG: hypothetical protein OHK93_002051 [Ramalina farinacea]|uniref:DUF7730 domain-containing protein n=1 Tax=Ramalina farinacea TaxID=258253 RepID=A0AA43TTE6_9LECA|nr:hypothetical protein [Ramalina farinacea]